MIGVSWMGVTAVIYQWQSGSGDFMAPWLSWSPEFEKHYKSVLSKAVASQYKNPNHISPKTHMP